MTVISNDVQRADLRRLAVAVVIEAMRDVKNRNRTMERRLDALLFLTGPDALWWCEWAGLSFVDPVQLVTSGRLRRVKLYGKGKVMNE